MIPGTLILKLKEVSFLFTFSQQNSFIINIAMIYIYYYILIASPNNEVTEESEIKQVDTNIPAEAWLTIDPNCKYVIHLSKSMYMKRWIEVCNNGYMRRVLTVHGTADVDVVLEEAYEIGKCIEDHQLQIVQGADHTYFSRLDELAAAVVTFAKQCVVGKEKGESPELKAVDQSDQVICVE